MSGKSGWAYGLCMFALIFLMPSAAKAADRDTALALLEGADALLKSGKYAKALQICQRALSVDANCSEAHYKTGECHEKLGQFRKAIGAYLKAAALAQKDNPRLERKARLAAEKVSPGLLKINEANQALIRKIQRIADEALTAGRLETALESYNLILSMDAGQAGARTGAAKAKDLLAKRGDPVKAKLSEEMLVEVWYLLGAGKKSDARKMAGEVARLYPKTSSGREAVQLMASNFRPPGKEDTLALKQALAAVRSQRKRSVTHATPGPSTYARPRPASSAPSPGVANVDALEQTAEAEAKGLTRGQLVSRFQQAFASGKAFYAKAAPGSEGNQDNLRKALKEFIRCEALYAQIEERKLANAQLEQQQQQASMLRYGCMKMTILSHR